MLCCLQTEDIVRPRFSGRSGASLDRLTLSAAAGAAFCGSLFIRLRPAAAFTAIAPQHAVNDCRCAADAGLNGEGTRLAVFAAGAAFHTGVAINNLHAFPIHFEHIVGTDSEAHTAAVAFFCVQPKRDDIFQINRVSHFFTPRR
jgi:hypothetical protein